MDYTDIGDLDLKDLEALKKSPNFSFPALIGMFKKAQKTIKEYERFMNSKVPDIKKQAKEIRRKERLQAMYHKYLLSLKINPSKLTSSKPAYIQSETQLKLLVSHQDSVLSDFQKKCFKDTLVTQNFTHSIYKNPLIFKILALYSPESKQFLPEATNYTICSLYFHDEEIAKKNRVSLAKEIDWKISEFRSKITLKSIITKRKASDKQYKSVQDKLWSEVDRIFEIRKLDTDKQTQDASNPNSCIFVEGRVVFSVNAEKIAMDYEKKTNNLRIEREEEETIEVEWTTTKKLPNISRLGFLQIS